MVDATANIANIHVHELDSAVLSFTVNLTPDYFPTKSS